MSAMLHSLLDKERLADCIANDRAMGLITPPPVERDEAFFARADATEPSAAQKAAREYEIALAAQMQRNPQGGFCHE